MNLSKHQLSRIRHELRGRMLTVTSVEHLTPRMLRIAFTAPDLNSFISPSADDHIKLFFPTVEPSTEGEREDSSPCMRDFTPRKFDTNQLIIDFALHEAGPATQWAAAAQVGDTLKIGGPRGSTVIPDDFDWYLLIGDETALPAIGRRIEDLRAGVPVVSAVVVDSLEEAQIFKTQADWTPIWASRDGMTDDTALLQQALASYTVPPGEGFIWIAAEADVGRAMRTYAMETLKQPREWIKAAGYWKRGQADAYERFDD